jgi:hypothetical protein
MPAEELRANWEHVLVGEQHTYTLQAGSQHVHIERRPVAARSGVAEAPTDLVPIEELRGVLEEWEATVGRGD